MISGLSRLGRVTVVGRGQSACVCVSQRRPPPPQLTITEGPVPIHFLFRYIPSLLNFWKDFVDILTWKFIIPPPPSWWSFWRMQFCSSWFPPLTACTYTFQSALGERPSCGKALFLLFRI